MGFVYPADVNSLYEKMELSYKELKNLKRKERIAKAARENVLTNFDINNIVNEQWLPFLTELQEELLGKPKE